MTLEENRKLDAANARSWKDVKLSRDKLFITRTSLGITTGMYLYLAFYQQPIVGYLHVAEEHCGCVAEVGILDCYTVPMFRRKGILTMLHEELFKTYDIVSTPHANKLSEPFLLKEKYKYDSVRGGWSVMQKTRGRSI